MGSYYHQTFSDQLWDLINQTKFDQTNFIINGEVNKLISMHKCPDSSLSLHSCMSMVFAIIMIYSIH